ncbi:hypothetical protein [Sinorhizobium mexicanum]|uniref:Uncharacterized protein n=1 Tax=Sinorhizobium mexicanum TaxID=375549 RepID=A0A859QSM7_9HYPH|nr:hypothetical protein [Sinorhizobium mexicanum]MBP1881829.1 DNA-directed RNA polymerase specialized sigma24 family protein [Sinorhizobium mexicanum]QLL61581.1 hypothetical protein FKV68_09030 [Sinorhizobium mexicanum]
MPACDGRAAQLAEVLRTARAVIALLLGGLEEADALLTAALAMPSLVPLETPQNFLLYLLDQAKAVSETICAPCIRSHSVASGDDDAAQVLRFLTHVPFDRRLAYTLVEVAGFTLREAARYCRRMPGEVRALVDAAHAELMGAALSARASPPDGRDG